MSERLSYRDLIVYTITGLASVAILFIASAEWSSWAKLPEKEVAWLDMQFVLVITAIPILYLLGQVVAHLEYRFRDLLNAAYCGHTILGACKTILSHPSGRYPELTFHARGLLENPWEFAGCSSIQDDALELRNTLRMTDLELRTHPHYGMVDRLYVLSDLFKGLTFLSLMGFLLCLVSVLDAPYEVAWESMDNLGILAFLTFVFYGRAQKLSKDYVEELLMFNRRGYK